MRGTENQLFQVPLASGMDQATDPRSAQPGTLYRVENCRIRTAGSLQKRCGTKGIGGVTNTPSSTEHCLVNGGGSARPTEHPAFVGRIGEQFIAGTTAGEMFVNGGNTDWNFRGSFSTVLPHRAYAMSGGGDAFSDVGEAFPSIGATSSGHIASCYLAQDDTLRIAIRTAAGEIIYRSAVTVVAPAQITRIVAIQDIAIILWQDGTAIKGQTLTISSSSVVAGSATTIATLASASSSWDTSAYSDTAWFLIYQEAAANVRISQRNTSMAETDNEDIVAPLSYFSIWADPTYSKLWVGMLYDAAGAGISEKFAIYDISSGIVVSVALTDIDANFTGAANLGQQPTPPLFGPHYSAVNPTSAFCVLSRSLGSPKNTRSLNSFLISAAGVVSSSPQAGPANHLVPISKPDARQRVWCAMDAYEATHTANNRAILLLRFPDAGISPGTGTKVIEAWSGEFPDPGYLGVLPDSYQFGANAVAETSTGIAAILPIVLTTMTTSGGSGTEPMIQARIYEYSTQDEEPHRQLVNSTSGQLLPGQPTEIPLSSEMGIQTSSSGAVEFGFGFAPMLLHFIETPTPGAIPAGSYAYIAVIQWPDALGRRQLSAISDPHIVTTTVESSIEIHVAFSNIGQRPPITTTGQSGPTVLLYRTVEGGQNYQLLPLEPARGTAFGTVIFTDTTLDAVLAENEFIYTDGGVLPNVLAPTCRFMAMAEDRLWCGGLWDPTILEASKVRVPDEPLNFTGDASHQVSLPEVCTGLAYMDGQVVAFAHGAIYLIGGDGPNDQGAGSFLPPRLLTRSVGCIDYRSVLETAIGILFQGAQGIWLLPRGFGAPIYVGMKAQDTLLANPDILSSVVTTSSEFRLARFLIAESGEPSSDLVLTLDLDSGNWFTDTYDAEDPDNSIVGFSELGPGPDGATFLRYNLTFPQVVVWYEDETRFYDEFAISSDFIARTVQTSWLQPFAPGGWGLAKKALLTASEQYGSTTETEPVNVTLTVDTDDASESLDWDLPATGESICYRGIDLKRRNSTMARATIVEASADPGDTDADHARGPKLLNLTLEVSSLGGIRPLTDSERS